MALVLNEEQQMLRDAARGFLSERAPVSHLRALRDNQSESRYSPELWLEMAEMGWPAILVPEAYGGLDYGYTGIGIVLEETGRTLTPSPLLCTALGGVTALIAAASDQQKQDILPGIASGERLLALAVDETAHHRPDQIACTAVANDDGFSIDGHKSAVVDGHIADTLIVAARTSGATGDANGISLFLVPADAAGLEISPQPMLDTHVAAKLVLNQVQVGHDALLGALDQGAEVLHRTLDAMRIGQSAELLGLAQEAFDRTMDYLKERKQFGVPIGSFQALQHRAAVMYSELELCRSAVLHALQALDAAQENGSTEPAPTVRLASLASLAKTKLSQIAHLVCTEAVQMHGGIGMTDEFDIGLFLKRCQILETCLGDPYFHLDRFATLHNY